MTRVLVLGMLDVQPLSGYDIQQVLRLSDAERWGGVLIGSIYHALKKMEKEGLVAVDSIEQTGHRQKAIYKITKKGQAHLQQLVGECLEASSVSYPSTLYSGLSFIEKISNDDALTALYHQRDALAREYAELDNGMRLKNAAMSNHIPPMTNLIFENMFAIVKQQQSFVEKAIQLLESEK
ncbi:PadR family transcriptional regulator [Acetobacterium bakii]|uniref:PadR family transcriptional regulator n=1 Tax=Acetobacterium bakii TaxID=52689 RepID=A0A0L6TYZ5_9FIRM|nr:PadR family transcriptional regulator [Acetobacterium bakii]KNZ41302.1 PadR family transcriptional regulator [Acetobacterium bakii]